MGTASDYISQLADFELAFLKKYKYGGYLSGSQALVDHELMERKLSVGHLETLVAEIENSPDNVGCPRCNSGKIRSENISSEKSSSTGIGLIASFVSRNKSQQAIRRSCDICNLVLGIED